jgi:hypothetical protein
MVRDGGIHQHGLGVLGFDHRFHVGEEKALVKSKLFAIASGQSWVGIRNSHQFNVRVLGQSLEEAAYMAMDKAYDSDA